MRRKIKFREEWYLKVYLLAREGASNTAIAQALGMSPVTFDKLVYKKSALYDALTKGREKGSERFVDYVYGKLSDEVKTAWDKLNEKQDPNAEGSGRKLVAMLGKKQRQQLLIHAALHSNFNLSKACKRLGFSYKSLQAWREQDPDFAAILEEIQWHKGNFFEDHLVRLVKKGDSPATIFANRTYNRNRGYNDKVNVELSGSESKEGGPTFQEVLDSLPLEQRLDVLRALRNKQDQKRLEHRDETKNQAG